MESIKKELIEALDKRYITMDELRDKMNELLQRIETVKAMTPEYRYKIVAEHLAKIITKESLTGGADTSSLVPRNVADVILMELMDSWIFQNTTLFPDTKGVLLYQGDTVEASWTAVGSAPTPVDQQVNVIDYNTHRLVAGQSVGRDLLQKASPDVAKFLLQAFKNSFINALTKAFILGTGSGQPKGLYSYSTIPVITLATGNTTIDKITYDNISDLYFTIPSVYREKSMWFMKTSVLQVIKKLKDLQGAPIFSPTDNTIFGRPVKEVPYMSDSGATNPVIYFGYAPDYFIFTDNNFIVDTVTNSVDMVQKGQVYIQLTGYFDGQLVSDKHFVGLKLAAA